MVDPITLGSKLFRRYTTKFFGKPTCALGTSTVVAVATAVLFASNFWDARNSPSAAKDRNDYGDYYKRMEQDAREQQRQAERMQRDSERQARQQQKDQEQQTQDSSRNQIQNQRNDDKNDNQSQSSKQSNNDQSKSDDDDQSDNQDGNNRKNDGKNSRRTNDNTSSGAPSTVEQWLKQLVGSKPAVATTAAPTPDGKNGDAKNTVALPSKTGMPLSAAAPVTAKPVITPAASTKPKAGGSYPQIQMPATQMLPEVLAVNATPATVERAKALGFKTAPATTLAALDFSITRLVPPSGMSQSDAQALLQRELPAGSFSPNQKYRIYRTASGTDATADGIDAKSGGNGPVCSGDRCFAREVIGWKPELRGCGSGIKIGVIDTSVDVSHPAFAHRRIELKHLGPAGADAPNWHGTGVTALLAGDATSGTPGLIPDANFYIADIFHADTDKEPSSDTVSMLRAFDWLEAKGVKIVNMSLSGPPDDLIRKAIDRMSSKGILFVAAAGNDGPTAGPSFPAAYDQVIAVTAVNKNLQSYRYANRGSYINIAAPGVAIWTAMPGSKEGYHSGTSFATPYATATLAALYPKMPVKTKTEALREIQFKDLGEPGPDPVYGQGLLLAPSACSASQIANASPGDPGPASTGSISPAKTAEQLPWLSLQGN